MGKLGIPLEENRFLTSRLRKFFIGTQIAAMAGIANLLIFGDRIMSDENVLFFRLDLVAFVIGVITTAFLFPLLDRGQYLKAVASFLWVWTLVMTFMAWFTGGLSSPLMLSYPILIMFAALFTHQPIFLSIFGFLFFTVIFMGLNHSYLWVLPPEGMAIKNVSKMISTLIINTLVGYVCWLFSKVLKSLFDDFLLENKRVIASQTAAKELANHDPLTGSLNRSGSEIRYKQLLDGIDSTSEHAVVYFIDLDHFKNINDLFDHNAGDQLLCTVSQRLDTLLDQKNGFSCRFGGDEFVLALQVAEQFDTEAFAKEIMTSLCRPHIIFGAESEVTASIGIASDYDSHLSFNCICKQADMAMYKAKQSGKNQYHIYSDGLQHAYMRNLNILNSLKGAISNKQLDVYFQPKVNLYDGSVEGVEALLRWNRGNDDHIGPEEFIPIIESTELIHSVGAWVINEACSNCKQWQEAGTPLKVAVNASALQLTRPTFVQSVKDALNRHQLSPDYLEIEITEHSLLKESPIVDKQLEKLKTLGVSLTIDDFGTGYSNMSYLTRLKVDTLKLDRSFVSQVSQSEEHCIVVTAIIKMAQVLGMKVVAEGIETSNDRDALKELNCDIGQGYFWSKAVPGSDLLKTIGSFT